ncbi:hypothetical protein GOP47_0025931 [Adiantum capillus-veneris]|uniref:Uncharacterized protein n=1 Tax=Adiantum capillus-veneris TaxID=13818 RepID=A0A9D4U1I5_ADICA|nr:hypothetical protein GOP47_0025931 [Adiantum capillus-veneris]
MLKGKAGKASDEQVYIVTLHGSPAIHKFSGNGGSPRARARLFTTRSATVAYTAELVARHDNLLSGIFTSSSYKKLYSYSHVLNGFAVQLTSKQADALRSLPGVRRLEKDCRVVKLTTHTPEFLGLSTGAWPREGGPTNAGEGVVIGIIDTGIDPTHPSFSVKGSVAYPPLEDFHGKCEENGGSPGFSCNGKIIAAQHFAAAAQAAGAFNSSNDFASPLDGDGHGSHTASIAAGNHGVFVSNDGFYFGEASGMAPRARISVYKALYRQFGGFMSDVVAAIDQAAKDGVDVLSLSVGPSSPPSSSRVTYLNAFDVALLSAVKAGVFVVQAAGNGGPYPRTMASFSPWIMSVAAGLDDRNYSNSIYLGNGAKLTGAGLAPATPGDQMYNLVLAEDALANTSGFSFSPSNCQQPGVLNKTLIQGKILLCTYSFSFIYGASTVKRVSDTAKNLGAVGFVLLAKTDLPGNKFNPVPLGMPGIVITNVQDSLFLLDYYNASNGGSDAWAKIGNGMNPTFQGTAPQVALYSSRGPGVKDYTLQDSDILKPNILGPGSLIWGAWSPIGTDEPDFQGEHFAMMSGTSMATPHIAGVAALIRQAHPDWSPAAIASAMMTTALVTDNKGQPLLAQHYSSSGGVDLIQATPFDFGSGAINATAALDPGLVFDAKYEDYISFLCSVTQTDHTQVMNVTGSSCGVKGTSTSALNTPSITLSSLVASRSVTRSVTNVAGVAETYILSYVEPPGISMQVSPQSFPIEAGKSVAFSVGFKVAAPITGEYSFGSLVLRGDKGHLVRIPLAIRAAAR